MKKIDLKTTNEAIEHTTETKSCTSIKEKQVEEKPVSEDCNEEKIKIFKIELGEDLKFDANLAKLDKLYQSWKAANKAKEHTAEKKSCQSKLLLDDEKVGTNKTKGGKNKIRQEFLVNNKESQKEYEEMTRQSNTKDVDEPAVETLAAKSMKRPEATA
ncbi:hypothetical protein QYM36_003437, partial [Artemia franciscana]